MKTLLVIAVIACLAVGAIYAKHQAVASFEHAIAVHQQKVNA